MNTTGRGKRSLVVSGLLSLMILVFTAWLSWDHIQFWWLFESMGNNAQGYPEYRHRETGIVLVGLPGGTFEMGSPEDESGREENEGPAHKVTLSPFLIAKYEVSQAEWKKVMGNNPSWSKGDALPVVKVSWEDCQEFCEKTGLSLPAEAQWEYACRAGTSGAYAGTGKLDDMGWSKENSGDTTHPVGEKQPNDFGIHDMHGNVLEWCEDWYQEDFYPKSTGVRDALCENSGSGYRVIRGGHRDTFAGRCRSACRDWFPPADSYFCVGFRPAWSSP